MKERELLIRSVVNLMLAVFARSVTEGQLLGPEVTVRWVACFVCGVSCRSRYRRHPGNSSFATAKP